MEAAEGTTARGDSKRLYRAVEEKLRIVEKTLTEEVSVAVVGRLHGVNANQLFHWPKLYQSGPVCSPPGVAMNDKSRLLPLVPFS